MRKKGGTIWCMDNTLAHSKATVFNRLQVREKLQFSKTDSKQPLEQQIKTRP